MHLAVGIGRYIFMPDRDIIFIVARLPLPALIIPVIGPFLAHPVDNKFTIGKGLALGIHHNAVKTRILPICQGIPGKIGTNPHQAVIGLQGQAQAGARRAAINIGHLHIQTDLQGR